MQKRKFYSCMLGVLWLTGATFAQQQWQLPRMANGVPDLQGTWSNATLTTLERPDNFDTLVVSAKEAGAVSDRSEQMFDSIDSAFDDGSSPQAGQDVGGYNSFWMDPGTVLAKVNGNYHTSVITDPADGQLPYSFFGGRWALAKAFFRLSGTDGPEQRPLGERCMVGFGSSGGPPMLNVLYNNNYQIVQSQDHVMILVEMNHDVRIIRIGDKHIPDSIKPWMGDSIGHWEGDTLVVETTNIHPQQNIRAALRHVFYISENAKIIERFTRIAEDEIAYEFSVDDPDIYTQVWHGKLPMLKAEGEIYEYACHEGNYSLKNILAGARKEDEES